VVDIVQTIREGKLHYRRGSVYGNPFLRLLRREVGALVQNEHGAPYVTKQKSKTKLARIDGELKRLRAKVAALEARRAKLRAEFDR
jgi:hypothetical protein